MRRNLVRDAASAIIAYRDEKEIYGNDDLFIKRLNKEAHAILSRMTTEEIEEALVSVSRRCKSITLSGDKCRGISTHDNDSGLCGIHYAIYCTEQRQQEEEQTDRTAAITWLTTRAPWKNAASVVDEYVPDIETVVVDEIPETPQHVLSSAVDPVAESLVSWGYRSLGRAFRSRRYEGFKRRLA